MFTTPSSNRSLGLAVGVSLALAVVLVAAVLTQAVEMVQVYI